MARFTVTDANLRKIAEKYVRSLTRKPDEIPDIQVIIAESLKRAAPDRDVSNDDIGKVVKSLSSRLIINDSTISEVSKAQVEISAKDDLVFAIKQYVKQLKIPKGKQAATDIESIIKASKLDPFKSTPHQIRIAVQDFYTSAEPAKSIEVPKQPPEKPHVEAPKAAETPTDPKATATAPPEPLKAPEPRQSGSTPKKKIEVEYVPPADPKNLTFFDKIRKKMERYGLNALSRTARNWLVDNVNKAKTIPNRRRLISEGGVAAELVGNMFMYFYDAKTKDELPYWDMFPLIFMVELYGDGWLGLNLHYLPVQMRIRLFDKLLEFANNKKLDQITKLQLSYSLIKSVSRFPEAQPCIKRYLSSQVKSELIKIAPSDWEIAVFLPVEQFQKQAKEKVWKDSRARVRGKK